ncbi:hypothetical protein D3C76_1868550 [compost metagenome]
MYYFKFIVINKVINMIQQPAMNGANIFISNKNPARVGPAIFPTLIYALFIPAA